MSDNIHSIIDTLESIIDIEIKKANNNISAMKPALSPLMVVSAEIKIKVHRY